MKNYLILFYIFLFLTNINFIHGQLVVSISPSDTSICNGDVISLNANSNISGTTYLWSNGSNTNSINVSPTLTTTYTVTGTSPASETASATVTITVLPKPNLSYSATTTVFCNIGGSDTITVSSDIPGTNYNWNTGDNTDQIIISVDTSSLFQVTGTAPNGCSSTLSIFILIASSPTIYTTNDTICLGETATISVTGDAMGYQWNNGSNQFSLNLSPTTTTIYTVTGTSSLGCTASATATIVVNPIPNITIISNPSTVCKGSSVNITANGANTYLWSNGQNTQTINPIINQQTTFSVTGTSLDGCTNSNSITINIYSLPTITVSNQTICLGDTAILSAQGATNYSWSNGQNTNPIYVNPITTSTYSVTGTDNHGCTNSATATVTVLTNPQLTVNDTAICIGDTAFLHVNGADSYHWSNGINTANIIIIPNQTITYTVTGYLGTNCSSSATVTITVNSLPNFDINTRPAYCNANNGLAEITNLTGAPPYQYLWNTIPPATTQTITELSGGVYIVTVTDANGCRTIGQTFIETKPPFTFTTQSSPEHCGNHDGTINVNVTGNLLPISYHWSHNSTLDTNELYNLQSGNYFVTITDDLCTQEASINVPYWSGPNARFTPSIYTWYMDGEPIEFYNYTVGATSYLFDFGDGTYSEEANPDHRYINDGTFVITLYATDQYNCTSIYEDSIIVIENFQIFIPNAFSPNRDNLNDYFTPFIQGIDSESYEISIYSKTGKLMFHTTDINKSWDGNINDKNDREINSNTYIFIIKFTTLNMKDKIYRGFINVIH